MLHVRLMVERNKSQGKSLGVNSGLMNDRLRGSSMLLVRDEGC